MPRILNILDMIFGRHLDEKWSRLRLVQAHKICNESAPAMSLPNLLASVPMTHHHQIDVRVEPPVHVSLIEVKEL